MKAMYSMWTSSSSSSSSFEGDEWKLSFVHHKNSLASAESEIHTERRKLRLSSPGSFEANFPCLVSKKVKIDCSKLKSHHFLSSIHRWQKKERQQWEQLGKPVFFASFSLLSPSSIALLDFWAFLRYFCPRRIRLCIGLPSTLAIHTSISYLRKQVWIPTLIMFTRNRGQFSPPKNPHRTKAPVNLSWEWRKSLSADVDHTWMSVEQSLIWTSGWWSQLSQRGHWQTCLTLTFD